MTENDVFRIGSRDSALAVVQAEMLLTYLKKEYPEREVSLVTMKTTGDKILDRRLDQIGGKGLFVKELDLALRDMRTDLSVHSLKDLPMQIPSDLPLVGCSGREDARDVLILPAGITEPDFSKPIGTSSPRRVLQLRDLFPEAHFESVRGNLQTRLRKLDEGQYAALVLAAAGVKRMGLEDRISRFFSVDEIIPAAGQGSLGLQGRAGEDYSFLEGFCDRKAYFEACAERAFVAALDGDCSSPIAAYAECDPETHTIHMRGFYSDTDGTNRIREEYCGSVNDVEDCTAVGEALAEQIRRRFL